MKDDTDETLLADLRGMIDLFVLHRGAPPESDVEMFGFAVWLLSRESGIPALEDATAQLEIGINRLRDSPGEAPAHLGAFQVARVIVQTRREALLERKIGAELSSRGLLELARSISIHPMTKKEVAARLDVTDDIVTDAFAVMGDLEILHAVRGERTWVLTQRGRRAVEAVDSSARGAT